MHTEEGDIGNNEDADIDQDHQNIEHPTCDAR